MLDDLKIAGQSIEKIKSTVGELKIMGQAKQGSVSAEELNLDNKELAEESVIGQRMTPEEAVTFALYGEK